MRCLRNSLLVSKYWVGMAVRDWSFFSFCVTGKLPVWSRIKLVLLLRLWLCIKKTGIKPLCLLPLCSAPSLFPRIFPINSSSGFCPVLSLISAECRLDAAGLDRLLSSEIKSGPVLDYAPVREGRVGHFFRLCHSQTRARRDPAGFPARASPSAPTGSRALKTAASGEAPAGGALGPPPAAGTRFPWTFGEGLGIISCRDRRSGRRRRAGARVASSPRELADQAPAFPNSL